MEFKIGDRVRVKEKLVPQGWYDIWVEEMDAAVGEEGLIYREAPSGWEIKFDNDPTMDNYGIFNYPEESLEKI